MSVFFLFFLNMFCKVTASGPTCFLKRRLGLRFVAISVRTSTATYYVPEIAVPGLLFFENS